MTCGTRAAAGSARFADASLSQLAQEGSRRLFARFCGSCRRHYQRAAAVSGRGGGRRPRHRLRFTSALRAEIQRGSSAQQSCTLLLLYSPMFVLAAAKLQQRCAACCGSGCLRLLRCRGLADTSHPSVFHTHRTHPTNKRQAAAGSLARSALAACRHEPLAESARRSPWLPPTAPVPLPRFACFVSGSIEAIHHASISRRGSLCSPMHRSCWHGCANAIRPAASAHFSCRLHRADGTLHVAGGSRGEPTRHVCRHGVANGVSRASSARFSCGAGSGGDVLSRRPPLCGPSGYCLRQTPSVPPIGYRSPTVVVRLP